MTTQEATHSPAAAAEETTPFDASPSPLIFEDAPLALESQALEAEAVMPLEVEPLPSLESAPPLLLESVPTTFLESEPPPLEAEPLPPSLEATPPPSPTRPATPQPARRVSSAATDPFAVGVRLLRLAPAWLLLTTLGCALVVLLLGWMKAGGGVSAVTIPQKQNDARALKTTPKADAAGPATAAANSPDVATPPADAPGVVASNPAPAQPAQPAPPAPAAAEQIAPVAPQAAEKAQAEQPAPADDAGAKFTVQVGSYNNQSEANGHVSRLRADGFETRAAAVELPGRGTWYRVQVGRFAERGEASKALAQLRAKGAAAGAIVAPL
jgi:cell division septation protein DedD